MQTRIFQFIALACLSSVALFACSSGDDSAPPAGTGGSAGTGGGTGSGGGTGTTGFASCDSTFNYATYQTPPTTLTLTADIQPIFAANCTTAGTCHQNGAPFPPNLGPAMGTAATAAQLMAIRASLILNSTTAASVKRVLPNEPENSFIMVKIDGNPSMCTTPCSGAACGARMPYLATTPLDNTTIGKIRDWIKTGATL